MSEKLHHRHVGLRLASRHHCGRYHRDRRSGREHHRNPPALGPADGPLLPLRVAFLGPESLSAPAAGGRSPLVERFGMDLGVTDAARHPSSRWSRFDHTLLHLLYQIP